MLTWLVEHAAEDAAAVVRPSGETMTYSDLALAVRLHEVVRDQHFRGDMMLTLGDSLDLERLRARYGAGELRPGDVAIGVRSPRQDRFDEYAQL